MTDIIRFQGGWKHRRLVYLPNMDYRTLDGLCKSF